MDENGALVPSVATDYELKFYDNTPTEITANLNDEDGDGFIDLTQIQGGLQYTVEAKHLPTGCVNTRIINLPEEWELPSITLESTENTNCVGGTGTVTATLTYKGVSYRFDDPVNNDLSGVSFLWSNSGGVIGSPTGDPTNGFINQLVHDNYSVTATIDSVGCTSLIAAIDVDYIPTPIDVGFYTTINTSCDVVGNGEIFAGIDLDGNGTIEPSDTVLANIQAAGYSLSWSSDSGTPIPNTPSENRINQLEGNDYYIVSVSNSNTGCTTTHTEFLQKIITIPDITVSAIDYLTCDTPVEVDVLINNIAAFNLNNLSDFEFTWYRGIGTGSTPLDPSLLTVVPRVDNQGVRLTMLDVGADGSMDLLPADDYSVVVRHINSTCTSEFKTDRIDPPSEPLFNIDPTMHMAANFCGTAEGVAYVTVTENVASGYGAPVGPFTYEWYEGAPTNTAPVKYFNYVGPGSVYTLTTNNPDFSFYTDPQVEFGTSVIEGDDLDDIGGTQNPEAVISGVTDGVYTVVVTDVNTGCKEYITFQIPFADAQQSNIVDVVPITDCSIDNGEIRVQVVPDPADTDNGNPEDFDIYVFAGGNPTLPTAPGITGTRHKYIPRFR